MSPHLNIWGYELCDVDEKDISMIFLTAFKPWEVEEMVCNRDFLARQYEQILEEVNPMTHVLFPPYTVSSRSLPLLLRSCLWARALKPCSKIRSLEASLCNLLQHIVLTTMKVENERDVCIEDCIADGLDLYNTFGLSQDKEKTHVFDEHCKIRYYSIGRALKVCQDRISAAGVNGQTLKIANCSSMAMMIQTAQTKCGLGSMGIEMSAIIFRKRIGTRGYGHPGCGMMTG